MADLALIQKRFLPDIEVELKTLIGRSPQPLYDIMRYHLGWIDEQGSPQDVVGGKRLRSILCLLACQTVGGDWRLALPAAAAVELTHNFSLIHDDIEDESLVRRGRATVWSIWGKPQAINVGDSMYTLAKLALLRLEDVGSTHRAIVCASNLLNEACLKLCEGQYLDLCYERRLDIGIDDYLEMIGCKTATMFRCSMELGASIGTEDKLLIEQLGNFGYALGMAFQLQDDILNIWGDSNDKVALSDILSRKKTLPVVYALENASDADKDQLKLIYQKDTLVHADVEEVLKVLASVDAQSYANAIAEKYYTEVFTELSDMAIIQSAKDDLHAIAAFAAERRW
ncbi:polyprenyl synthetase family protein [Chloroflexota bacterium]